MFQSCLERFKMRIVDLFAGCGGLSKGFQDAGFQIVAAFEFWNKAAECYALNFSHPVFTTDLSNIEEAVGKIQDFQPDIIIGGPPCQDFSHAGKRVEGSRAGLTEAYAEIVRAVRPKYFVMENVDRARNSRAFREAHAVFKQLGYGLTMMVLDASRCGVPQKRKRFFCIGELEGTDDFLRERLLAGQSSKDMTLRDYFGAALDFEFYYRHPRNYCRRAVYSIDEPAPTMRGVNRPVPKGYPGHPNDACPVDENVRALTTLERSLIQTFPADYHWCGSKTDMEQMIGNAVPVKLGEYVARTLKNYIERKNVVYKQPVELTFQFAETGFRQDFAEWLVERKRLARRTAGDMASRVKRAHSIRLMDTGEETVLYLHRLSQCPEFQNLSPSVRSQLKRAVALYGEYLCATAYDRAEASPRYGSHCS